MSALKVIADKKPDDGAPRPPGADEIAAMLDEAEKKAKQTDDDPSVPHESEKPTGIMQMASFGLLWGAVIVAVVAIGSLAFQLAALKAPASLWL